CLLSHFPTHFPQLSQMFPLSRHFPSLLLSSKIFSHSPLNIFSHFPLRAKPHNSICFKINIKKLHNELPDSIDEISTGKFSTLSFDSKFEERVIETAICGQLPNRVFNPKPVQESRQIKQNERKKTEEREVPKDDGGERLWLPDLWKMKLWQSELR
ncbi:hypothetical protein TorRG33x02_060260, partial [Trema orientale]